METCLPYPCPPALRFAGTDIWSQQARSVVMMAAELGLPLDYETIILSDVRDLQALRNTLQRSLHRQPTRWQLGRSKVMRQLGRS